jgi:PAS domain S-box-containing protein
MLSIGISSLLLTTLLAGPTSHVPLNTVKLASKLIAFFVTSSVIVALIQSIFRAHSQLYRSEARFRRANELIPFGGWLSDSDGNFLQVSDSFLQAFQVGENDCKGLGWLDLIVSEEREAVRQAWHNCARTSTFWDREYHMVTRSNELRTVLSRGVRVAGDDEEEPYWIGIHLDVTERDILLQQRLQQARDIERSNKELSQIAHVSSHDLQEPLRIIASYLQLIAKRYRGKLDADADTFIDYAVGGANRLKALLQDLELLNYVGKYPERRAMRDLTVLAKRARAYFEKTLADRNSSITIETLPAVRCDEAEITQLFRNLFDNALKYRSPDKPADIRVTGEKSGDWCIVRVKDNGIGIEPQYLGRIFDLFQQLRAPSNLDGTGIGLTICKKIVEVHGGQISVESEPGAGSCFCLKLPAN